MAGESRNRGLTEEDLPHYTYEDYVQWEGRWELIKGIPYAMVPMPALRHQELCQNIAVQLVQALQDCQYCKAYLPVDWQIDEDTVVQPDNLVVCGKDIGGEKLTETPVLVFEILSPSTTRKDRFIKFALYEHEGVKYYCIVDPESSSVEVFELIDKKYQKRGTYTRGKMTFDIGKCSIDFDFDKLFEYW
jgi:Uma2 family endonuclease